LIYYDTTNPNTRGIDSKLLLEGVRIKKPDLQRYAIIDQKALKQQMDKEQHEHEKRDRKKVRHTVKQSEECETETLAVLTKSIDEENKYIIQVYHSVKA